MFMRILKPIHWKLIVSSIVFCAFLISLIVFVQRQVPYELRSEVEMEGNAQEVDIQATSYARRTEKALRSQRNIEYGSCGNSASYLLSNC